MTVGSFAPINYVGGCCSSPASLKMIVRSFDLANCVRGCNSSPASLNMIVGNFALANFVGGYDSSPASLNIKNKNVLNKHKRLENKLVRCRKDSNLLQ